MKLSVGIPVYNAEAYIEQCARSLFAQTHEEMEYIFIDDASPDKSIDVLKRVLEDFPHRQQQVKIVSLKTSEGPGEARRLALSLATGDWIGYCDSDDWLDEDYFAKLLASAETARADIAYCPIVREYPDGSSSRIEVKNFAAAKEMIVAACPGDGFNSMVNKITRLELARSKDALVLSGVNLGEDLLYTAQTMLKALRVAYCPNVVYHYRQNPVSITRKGLGAKRPRDLLAVCEALEAKLAGPDFAPVRDRLRRDVLTAAIKARTFKDPVYAAVRNRLESPLCGDPRHGFVKKALLTLVDMFVWRGK